MLREEERRVMACTAPDLAINGGPKVKALEGQYAKFLGVKHVLALNYKPDDYPNIMAWLGRSAHMGFPPQLSEADRRAVGEGIRKVASVLL
jgi:hypothetical protein